MRNEKVQNADFWNYFGYILLVVSIIIFQKCAQMNINTSISCSVSSTLAANVATAQALAHAPYSARKCDFHSEMM